MRILRLPIAYPAAIPKIDFTGCAGSGGNNGGTCGTNSRLYQRLLTDNHNCWDNCASRRGADAGADSGLRRHADALEPRSPLGDQQVLSLTQGTIASGASRYDADTIAKYEFQSVVNNTTSTPAASIPRRI